MGRPTNKVRAERAAAAAAAAASKSASENAVENAVENQDESLDPKFDSDAPRPESRNEPRRLAMEEILARDRETKGIAEEAEENPEEKPEEPESEKPEEKTSEQEQNQQVEAQEEVAAESEPVVEMVKVKVNGKEYEVSKSDVEEAGGIRAYQTSRAAEERLEEAKQIAADNRKVQNEIAQYLQSLRPQQPKQSTAEAIASKMDAIRFGSPEESAAAMQEVINLTNPPVDQNQLTAKLLDTVNRNNAVEKFHEEFQDIVANPLLFKLAIALKDERAQQAYTDSRGNVDWHDFYRKIGNEVRSAVGRQSQPSSAQTASTPSQQTDKEAKKASIVNLPTAQARATLPKEEKPETRADVLNAMRKSRGVQTG